MDAHPVEAELFRQQHLVAQRIGGWGCQVRRWLVVLGENETQERRLTVQVKAPVMYCNRAQTEVAFNLVDDLSALVLQR